jgi:adenylyltransferase/sulfurtransferase
VLLKKPNVYGSIFRFEGMVTVFAPHLPNPLRDGEHGPCYRCMYPEPPDPGSVPSCAEGGVIGVLPGIIGTLQANEVIKLILGFGTPAIGKLTTFDARDLSFKTFKLRADPTCPVCGTNPTITAPIDYEQFCGVPALDPKSLEETAREAKDAKAQGKVPDPNLDARGLPHGYAFNPDWEVTPREVKSAQDKSEDFLLIDCREPHEWAITHLVEKDKLFARTDWPQIPAKLAGQEGKKIVVTAAAARGRCRWPSCCDGAGSKTSRAWPAASCSGTRTSTPAGRSTDPKRTGQTCPEKMEHLSSKGFRNRFNQF